MKQVSVRELRSNLASTLKSLPVQVVKNGKVIAIIQPQSVHNNNKSVHNSDKLNKNVYTKQDIVKQVKPMVNFLNAKRFCSKHNSMQLGNKYTCGCPLVNTT